MKTIGLLFLLLSATASINAQTKCDFAGNWATRWEGSDCQLNMIKTYGNTMTGTYYYENQNGTINGTIYGSVKDEFIEAKGSEVTLTGKWTEEGASGTFTFYKNCSLNKFTGNWKNDNGQEKGLWIGEK